MLVYIFKRLLGSIPTLFIVIFISFMMVHLTPGDPFSAEKALPPEVLKQLHHQYHLDLPLWQQFYIYIKNLLCGDFGYSYKYIGHSINSLVFPPGGKGGFFVSLQLGVYSIALATFIGIFLGVVSALTKETKLQFIDHIVNAITMVFISVPIVVTAPLAVFIFFCLFIYFSGRWMG